MIYTNPIKFWYMTGCLTLLALGFGMSMYENYWPIKVIDIHSPLKVKTKIVKAGQVLIYVGDYCQYKLYPATVSRTLLNDSAITLPIVNSVGKLGCHQSDVQIPIPEGAEPGLYHIEGIVTYKVNRSRDINVPFTSETFKVIK